MEVRTGRGIPGMCVNPPNSAVKITRNISGNANVKNADAGFRKNARFVYLI